MKSSAVHDALTKLAWPPLSKKEENQVRGYYRSRVIASTPREFDILVAATSQVISAIFDAKRRVQFALITCEEFNKAQYPTSFNAYRYLVKCEVPKHQLDLLSLSSNFGEMPWKQSLKP